MCVSLSIYSIDGSIVCYICTICLYASRDGWMWCPARHRGTCIRGCIHGPIARWDRCERWMKRTESSIDRSFVRVHRTVDERARRARTSPRTRSVASSIHPFIQSRIDGFFRHPLSTPGSFSRDIYDASRTPRGPSIDGRASMVIDR